jgi:hypothetical protein
MERILYPKPTLNSIVVDTTDLANPSVSKWVAPVDSVLRWVTVSWDLTLAGLINPPPNSFIFAYAGIDISDLSLTAKTIPNSGVFWRNANLLSTLVFGGGTEIQPLSIHGSEQIDFKDSFLKVGSTISLKAIRSGTPSIVVSVDIATCSVAEFQRFNIRPV